MTSSSIPHVSCNHIGPDFDWWRCNEEGYVGRPPSPFPASFEHARRFREDSADARYGQRGGLTSETNGCRDNCSGDADLDEATRRKSLTTFIYQHHLLHILYILFLPGLYWPLCQGPEIVVSAAEENDDLGLTPRGNGGAKKTPRLPHKRPAWVPAKMPNKWGVAGHPPPYTNYCKETLFNTRTADPAKVTIRTTF
ncbi:unnamed protein product [Lymnaea stagnalis]|uniref:Uncharacterized protein n=1 Tax=Lymnaea stagnalis TaxID=6523 RepID=A0AAV2GZR0_LYMST